MHPDLSRTIYHDGKAIRQMYNTAPGDTRMITIVDPDTGEVRIEERQKKYDRDAKVHHTGDQRQIWGCRFWLADVRGQDPHTTATGSGPGQPARWPHERARVTSPTQPHARTASQPPSFQRLNPRRGPDRPARAARLPFRSGMSA